MSQAIAIPAIPLPVDKYKLAFQEEAREILAELESTLLELNENPEDSELVGKAFRGLHTIKGSGSMFGFDDIAAFTHNLENAFDGVRNGRLHVTSELVDLTLAALDQIKAMLNSPNASGGYDASCRDVLARLLKLTGPRCQAIDGPGPSPIDAASNCAAESADWNISFAPGKDLLSNGADPLLLLRELTLLGQLRVAVDMSALPPITELEPERCYLRWDMTLTTTAVREAIADIFLFVEDECELQITQIEQIEQIERIETSALHCPGAAAAGSAKPHEPARSLGRRAEDRTGVSSIRVPTPKLDQFVDLVGELVTVQARLAEIASRAGEPEVVAVSEEIERLTSALRENSMSIRMVPVRGTFERFRRLVHDLARDLGKDVELTIDGADTELDKTVIDLLNDPLMHLIRNSMDHGIELPELRLAAGKQAVAAVRLVARYSGANVLIEVSDDGAGIDSTAVRERAVALGLIAGDAQLTDSQISSLIMSPGFSTAKKVTGVSGRGVGMDVVRQGIEALRGTIHISSKPGTGTTVTLRLPLTLAIIDGLLVRVGHAFFVLPLANSLECVELTRQDIANANGRHVANVRGEIIPYIRLREHFAITTERPEREQIMIAETEDGRCGFVVDEVLGDHQTVIKNLGHFYRHVQFISGATILGDGSVALILDPDRVVQDALRATAEVHRERMTRPLASWSSAGDGLQMDSS